MTEHERNLRDLAAMFAMAGLLVRNFNEHGEAIVPKEVMEYFNTHHPYSKQAKIREILTEYVNSQKQGANNGNT